MGKDSLTLAPHENPREVIVGCGNFRCDFAAGRAPEGLPVLFVDEQVYRELPAFLLATVDKLALLPWRGEAGMLFGRVQVREGRRFWGRSTRRWEKSREAPGPPCRKAFCRRS